MVLLALKATERVGTFWQRWRAGARAVLARAAHTATQIRAAVPATRALQSRARRRLQQLHQLLACSSNSSHVMLARDAS